jgi:DNA relaxase NicK
MSITKSVGFASTPLSNTGSFLESSSDNPNPPQNFPFAQLSTQSPKPEQKFVSRLDWLQGLLTLGSSPFEFLFGELSTTFKDTFGDDRGYFFEGKAFQHHRISDRGAMVFWNILENGDRDILIMLPAKFLAGCSHVYLLRRFITHLSELGFRATRVDSAIDDFTKSINWRLFDEAYDKGFAHGFLNTHFERDKKNRVASGWSYYLGDLSSDRYLVNYDKNAESGGEIDANRLEARFKRKWAKSAFAILASSCFSDKTFHQALVNLVCSTIDFYEEVLKEGTTSTFERVPLQWWVDFKTLVGAEGITITSGRTKTSIENTLDWFENQIEPSLAMIENFLEKTTDNFCEWLMDRVASGRRKLNSLHINKINSALLQLGVNDSVSYKEVLEGYF